MSAAEHVPSLAQMKIRLFADGADLDDIARSVTNPLIAGFTTNPTLMRKAGVTDYEAFGRAAIELVGDRPISFEVLADDQVEMAAQARQLASWGGNVYVKIPISTCAGESCTDLVGSLTADGVRVNVTAILTLAQVDAVAAALAPETPSVVSVFAGRIADTGRDPVPIMREALAMLAERPAAELLWASPRELLNLFQAEEVGCHIITMTTDLLNKLPSIGKDLGQLSLETVKMFVDDAGSAGYRLGGHERIDG